MLLTRFGHKARARRAVLWVGGLFHECHRDQILVRATTLVYPTLLSLIPALTVVVAVTDLMAGDAAWRITEVVMRIVLADAVSAVGTQLETMLAGVNFKGLGVVGVVAVLVTGSSVYFRVEDAYNAVWNTRLRRSWVMRMILFYTTLTLGPVVLGWGFHYSDMLGERLGSGAIGFVTPVLITAFAFVAAIWTFPDTTVHWLPATIGGVVSATLFEIAKLGFNAYVALFASDNPVTRLYGSLGLFPVFLIWIFILWAIVLFGVELAYCVQRQDDIIATESRRLGGESERRRHADALFAVQCLLVVASRYAAGEGPTTERLVTQTLSSDPQFVRDALEVLDDVGVLAESPTGYLPALPLGTLTLREVIVRYRESTRPSTGADAPGGDLLSELLAPGAERLDAPVAALIGVQ